jgi:hypothetical protein
MADELETIPRAAYTGRAAWHVKGNVVGKRVPLPEFLTLANMSYTIETVPALVLSPDGRTVIVPNQFHLQRNGTGGDGRIVSPHTVSGKYHATQPSEMGTILQPFVDQGFATWDAAFTLREGETEIMTIRLDDVSVPVSGDESDAEYYLVARNRHGGGGTLDCVVSRIRTVCANTERISFAAGADMKFRHDAKLSDRIETAAYVWEKANIAIREHAAKLSRLAIPCNVPATVDALLGLTGIPADKVGTRKANERDALIAAASNSPGTHGATLLDIYNAATWLGTHDTGGKGGTDADARLASIIDGTRGDRMESTLDALLVLT